MFTGMKWRNSRLPLPASPRPLSPLEALRAWMLLLVNYIAAKHIIAPALNSVVGGPSRLYQGSHTMIQGATSMSWSSVLQKSGDLRAEIWMHPDLASRPDRRLPCRLRR